MNTFFHWRSEDIWRPGQNTQIGATHWGGRKFGWKCSFETPKFVPPRAPPLGGANFDVEKNLKGAENES